MIDYNKLSEKEQKEEIIETIKGLIEEIKEERKCERKEYYSLRQIEELLYSIIEPYNIEE